MRDGGATGRASSLGSAFGFTVAELLTVVALLVVLSFLALPALTETVHGYRLRTAAWQIAHDLRLARQKAVTTGRRHRVCFSGCGSPVPVNGYLIQRQDGAVWQLDQMVPSPQDGLEVRSNATLTFAETGEAAGGTITISSAWGSYQVRAHFTGRVRVCQGTCQ